MLNWLKPILRLRSYQIGFLAAQLLVTWQVTRLSPAHRGGAYSTFLAPGIHAAAMVCRLFNYANSSASYDIVMIGVNLIVYGVIGGCAGWLAGRAAKRLLLPIGSQSPYCPCGYDLTGNISGVCPECGRAVDKDWE